MPGLDYIRINSSSSGTFATWKEGGTASEHTQKCIPQRNGKAEIGLWSIRFYTSMVSDTLQPRWVNCHSEKNCVANWLKMESYPLYNSTPDEQDSLRSSSIISMSIKFVSKCCYQTKTVVHSSLGSNWYVWICRVLSSEFLSPPYLISPLSN